MLTRPTLLTLQDPLLGTFVCNPSRSLLKGRLVWLDGEVDLVLSVSHKRDGHTSEIEQINTRVQHQLEVVRELWSDPASWDQRLKTFAAHKLLWQKNRHWLDKGEGAATREKIMARMELQSLRILIRGDIDFRFDDGDLFWGHPIIVRATLEDGPIGAALSR
jgi:hypothetical protein